MSNSTDLQSLLEQLPAAHLHAFSKRMQGIERIRQPKRQQGALRHLQGDVERCLARIGARVKLDYDDNLPVSLRREEIAAAIRDHQVVILAGETGSGKTTQLPKICMELGLGERGFIGHTQPRRIAARSVASRIADECQTPLGDVIGYKVRFAEKTSPRTRVKLMTDGILLAEIHDDRLLRKYDTLIIDEAHERSLNIDFLLGYIKEILPKRPDLKVIVTSATIETERFSKHFNDAPVLTVEGRTYAVEVRYQPYEDDLHNDHTDNLIAAVDELCAEGPGDILVFLNGEREIRDVADALEQHKLRDTEIVPLYARLSVAEQQRVFSAHRGRRIVLSTNVAETSLTVPGIKYVIDAGMVRISRYSYRSKVQRLPIEPISQASANQRMGRCGRVSEGICIRLYSEEDFNGRPAYTDPEILRTNLAAVVLQMTHLGLGEIERFPFMQPPDARYIRDAFRLLEEIGAVKSSSQRTLTPLGKQLSRLPIDPRLARMVLEGANLGVIEETLVLTAFLSIQDPRERPMDKQQQADEKHRRFFAKSSDFVTVLNLWSYLQLQQSELSQNQFRKLCKQEFLAYQRVREWQDLYAQLKQSAKELKLPLNTTPGGEDAIHKAMLSGLLSHIGFKDPKEQNYQGARNSRFVPFPGSSLGKSRPKWVMAAELVETSRLFARVNAAIEPEWIESLAQHLVKRSYLEPHWERKAGNVFAFEKQVLFGLPIVPKRKVIYASSHPLEAREVFIREALVGNDLGFEPAFYKHNRALISSITEQEEMNRRRDLLIDEVAQCALYDALLPAQVFSRVSLQSWLKQDKGNDQRLRFTREQLLLRDPEQVDQQQYPEQWRSGQIDVSLSYLFEPGQAQDGVTATIPLPVLNQMQAQSFEWGIPAQREELICALIRSLPKATRRHFVPAPNYAREALALIDFDNERLLPGLSRALRRLTGVTVEEQAWNLEQVPSHLQIHFEVVDEQGKLVGQGDNLSQLQHDLKDQVQESLSLVADSDIERSGLTGWEIDELPQEYAKQGPGYQVKAYPALVDKRDSVAVELFDHADVAALSHAQGLRRLLLLNAPSPVKYLKEKLSNRAKLALHYSPLGKVQELIFDCIDAACDRLILQFAADVRDAAQFAALLEQVRAELADATLAVAEQVESLLVLAQQINKQLKGKVPFDQALSYADIKAQLGQLVYRRFVSDVGQQRLSDVERYLKAMLHRLEKLPIDPHRDRLNLQVVERVMQAHQALQQQLKQSRYQPPQLAELRWLIEELRVSLFAQPIGAAVPVSEKRVMQQIEAVRKLAAQ